jgi:phosphopantetheinyl transferase (holo-ACP synthase)
LGSSEQARWSALGVSRRGAFVASRWLLRQMLHGATGIAPQDWHISAQPGTAPVAQVSTARAGEQGQAPCVSLSHRLGWVAAAVASVRVGVDLECDRPARSDPAERAALMLAPSELPAWQGLAADEREADLLARWTAKEAWFKASLSAAAPWDFRQVVARACVPAHANVRVWRSPPLHVAVSCADARTLADAVCDGLAIATTAGSFWHVARAVPAEKL